MTVVRGPLLDLAATAPWADIEDLTGSGAVLVLAPHPDDEALGCGGAIQRALDAGHRVVVAVMTDGRRSHPNSASFGPDRLASLRRDEAASSVETLTGSADAMVWLGVPDCELPGDGAGAASLVEQLARIVDDIGATAVWSAWVHDPHCDHEATARIARALAAARPGLALFSYPIWGRFAAVAPGDLPTDGELLRIDTVAQRPAKARAVAAHRSQMTDMIDDDPDGFTMDPALQHHFVEAAELFIREKAS
ncbi:LmbE family N-acetylglucosaminyl deacetylase [Amorphus suaedae]